MKVAILQPNYIPWRGYFDLIAQVDQLVLYEDVQYTKEDWRNRNKILGSQGPFWLTIPIKKKGLFGQKIKEAEILNSQWQKKHWRSIEVNYKKALYFNDYASELLDLYERDYKYLVEVNMAFISKIMSWLKVETIVHCSSSIDYDGNDPTEKVISLCKSLKATEYLSGPSAHNYIDPQLFIKNNIKLSFIDYSTYKSYPQLVAGYENESLSILDLILNCGPDAIDYMMFGRFKK
ncbi:MAG: WbqC family protein [Bdellovibrionaceae bacterium]|nr:WbqC family protein [Pseudobdellovibrionaceae bacterium]